MSLGNTYNSNTPRKPNDMLTVYSNFRMNNGESTIDPTCLTFRYWKSNLCIGIFPRKNTGNEEIAFDMDNGITVYLSHSKAQVLKHELELFLSDPVTYNGSGVPTNQGVITISNGSEYGKNTPVLTIRKVNDTGDVVASFAYEFKRNYHYSIRGYDGYNFTKVFDDYQDLEIRQLITILDEYVKASTNAVAFSVMSQRQFSAVRMENKLDAIANSLGVDIGAKSNSGRYSKSSYFDKSNSSSGGASSNTTTYASIDDIE